MSENETSAQQATEQEPTGAERLAQAEEDRQRGQAQPHVDNLEGASNESDARVEAARAEQDIDPASPAGQQAAMRRGDPVQLQGDDALTGHRFGTNTTHNESLVYPVAPQPGPQGNNFVTGAMGEPIPAGEGVVPERPGMGTLDMELGEAEGDHPREPVKAPWEDSEAERNERAQAEYAKRLDPHQQNADQASSDAPPKSAPKEEWVEHAVSQGADRTEAENSTKAELIEAHGNGGTNQPEPDGSSGPGVSQ